MGYLTHRPSLKITYHTGSTGGLDGFADSDADLGSSYAPERSPCPQARPQDQAPQEVWADDGRDGFTDSDWGSLTRIGFTDSDWGNSVSHKPVPGGLAGTIGLAGRHNRGDAMPRAALSSAAWKGLGNDSARKGLGNDWTHKLLGNGPEVTRK
jgi:hypothetical protein